MEASVITSYTFYQ